MGGSRATAAAAASSRTGRRQSSTSPAASAATSSQRASRRSPSGARQATAAAAAPSASAAPVAPMRTRTRTKRRMSQRAQSVPPKHKYSSPRSEAEMLKRAQEEKMRQKKPQRRAGSAKARGSRTAGSAGKGSSSSATKSASQKGKQSGSCSGKGKNASKGGGKGKGQRGSSSASGDDADEADVEVVSRPVAAPKMSAVERFKLSFGFERLEECMSADVTHCNAANAAELDPELVEAVKAVRAKQRAAKGQDAEEEERAKQEQQEQEEQDEAQRHEAKHSAAAAAAVPSSASADAAAAAPLVTKRGRISKKPEPAGKPLGALGAVRPDAPKKAATLHWNTEEYVRQNRLKFQEPTTEAQRAEAAASASAAALAAVSAATAAAVAAAAAYTPSTLDPLGPDRAANEIFQIPAEWRLQWADPSYRLKTQLAHMPTTEFDQHRSFELPFDEFGEMMLKFQKKDQPPRFQLVTQNRLRVTREFFNTAMGVVPRKATRADRDDEEGDSVCTCRYRDPALAPRKGSKEALAENAAGRSFNCGEECINRLLKIECTDANCGLVASGKTDACGNRLFQRASYFPGVEPFKTEFKGWGLRCPSSSIPAGSFILEYVGEIISNAMCQERMAAENERCRRDNERHMQRREEIRKREEKQRHAMQEAIRKESERVSRNNPNGHRQRVTPRGSKAAAASSSSSSSAAAAAASRPPSARGQQKKRSRIAYDTSALSDSSGDEAEYMEGAGPKSSNFYFLTIGDDVIIDAGVRGGNARFTNHSCAPNCHIEKWTVDGQVRIGIFANQTIPPGKELTIDYKYDRVGNVHRQACFCGEPNCAKFIGGRKKELEGDDEKKKPSRRKAKEPTKLRLDLADEVCAMCGDGGDMVTCDGRVCGQFCTRCFHLECVGLTEETAPTRWLCPYHSCDGCDSMRIKYWCRTCSESACEKCWNASRLGPLDVAEPLTLHLTRVRRDLPNVGRNVWTCCHTCQQDAMCLREDERAAAYDTCAAFMREAIAARRADPAQAGFGGELDAQTLVEQMDAQTFSPRFLLNYWDVTQQKRGAWDDGYVEPALRGLPEPEEESDEAFLARQYAEANASEGEEEEEDEDECKHKEEQPQIEPAAAGAPAALASAAAAAAAAAAAQPSDEAVPMDVDASDEDEAAAPVAVTRNRKGTKGKRHAGSAASVVPASAAAAAAAAASVAAAPAAAPPAASSRRRAPAAASHPVAAVATAAPAAAPAAVAASSSSSRSRGRTPSPAAAAAAAPSAANTSAARRRSAAIPPASPVTPRTRTPSATAVAAAASTPSSRGKPHARSSGSGSAALVTALAVAAAAAADRSGRAKRKRNAGEQTETESNQSSDSEIDTTQACAAKRAKRVSTSSRLVESLSEELLLRLTVELSKHTSRIARGSEAEAKLLAAQAKACGNKASIHQVRALWESLMVAQTKAKATTTTSRSPAPVKRSHTKKAHK